MTKSPTKPPFRSLLTFLASACVFGFEFGGLAAPPAFPGAEGYGAYAAGGRGGDVYHVTNLNASGAGSFFDAIATVPSAGRTIVFDVSGYIRFPSGSNGTRLTASKVTIAGQTAPGDGIGFFNNMFRISGDDIIVRHLRFRHGKYGSGGDCIDLDSGTLNAILDHITMQFSTDENMSSFGSPPENLTLQYSINAWGLESHSCGGLWDQNHATSHHNLWAHNHTRNPKARPNGLLEWINNVTFDWDIGFIMGDTESVQNYKANVINNYFLAPSGNTQSKAMVKGTVATNGKPNFTIFLSGNLMDNNGDGILNGTDKGYSIVEGTSFLDSEGTATAGTFRHYQSASAIAGSTAGVAADNALTAFKKVVSNAGALRLDSSFTGGIRDEVDTILFNKLVTQTHFHVTRESDTGASASGFGVLASGLPLTDTDRDGIPDLYESATGMAPASDDHNTAFSSSMITTGSTFFATTTPVGYTYLEEYLHFMASPHTTVAKNTDNLNPTYADIDLARYTSGFSKPTVTFTVTNVVGGTVTSLNGSNVVQGDGHTVRFTPTLNYNGRARFNFTVTDGDGSTWTQQFCLLVSTAGIPKNLLWKGDGTTNAWDNSATSNWWKWATLSTFGSGDSVTFDASGSTSPSIAINGTVTPGAMTVNSNSNYTFGGGVISGGGSLIKSGAGTLTFTTDNTFSSTLVDGGALVIGNNGSTGNIGSGVLTLQNGATFTNAWNVNNTVSVSAPIIVPAGHSATVKTGNRLVLSGSIGGAGSLTTQVQTSVTRFDIKGTTAGLTGDWSFTGSGGVRLYANGGSFNGFSGNLNIGPGITLQTLNSSGGNTYPIGALSGTGASATLMGNTVAGGGATTFTIGALNANTTYAGSIANGSTGSSLLTHVTKVGTGTLTLTGNCTYTGTTGVSNGWLLVGGALGNTPVTVASGAFLGGSGTMGGTVTANAGATLSPGTAPFSGATMTVGNGLSLNGNTLYYDMSNSPAGANDKIVMNGGVLAMAGTEYFQFLLLNGPLNSGTYTLITGGTNTSTSGVSLTHNLPSDSRQTFALQRPGAGNGQCYVQLVVGGIPPASLVWSGTGGGSGLWDTQATSAWSGGPTSTFFNSDAVTFDDTSANGNVTISGNVSPRVLTVNNTATAYTLGGTGSITGASTLVKSGAGALTISGSNTFNGGTTLNAGSIILAGDAANAYGLGTGAITFNGGTLTMSGFNGSSSTEAAPLTNNLIVPAGATGTLNLSQRAPKPGSANVFPALYGSLTGAGTLNVVIKFLRADLLGDWSAFTGLINIVAGDADGGDFRFGTSYAYAGFPNAALVLPSKISAYYVGTLASGAGTTIEVGELSGASGSFFKGGPTPGRALTYRIGGKGTDATFAGNIVEQDAAATTTSIVKTGAGTWTLSGASSYNGGTTVEQGTLKIAGSLTSGQPLHVLSGATLNLAGGTVNLDAVNITSGATLSGYGTINADLNNDGTIVSTSGTLTVDGNVVNNGTMRFTGGSGIVTTGTTNTFVNNGVLDLLTGSQKLPANLENNGVILDSSKAKATSAALTGNTFTVKITGYSGHNYQLERRSSLISGAWSPVGAAQAGDSNSANPLTFTDNNATGAQWFYRIVVTP